MRRAARHRGWILALVGLGGCFNPGGGAESTGGSDATTVLASSTSTGPGDMSTGPTPTTGGASDSLGGSGTGTATGDESTGTGTGTGTTGDDTGPAPVDCGAYKPGLDLEVCTATYLGGPEIDHGAAVDVAPDNTVVVAGIFPTQDFGLVPYDLPGGPAAVLRLAPDGRDVLSVTRVDLVVYDLEVDPNTGAIAVVGDAGVTVLAPDGASVLWHADLDGATRVAIGNDGSVAALQGLQVALYDPTGLPAAPFMIDVPATAAVVTDLAVYGPTGIVVTTGYLTGEPEGLCSEYSAPFLHAYGYDGLPRWKRYGWSPSDVAGAGVCGATQAYTVTIGRDGFLYYTGASVGGNNVHTRDPLDIASEAANVETDTYTKASNMLQPYSGIGYIARFEAPTGALVAGQFLVTRRTHVMPLPLATGNGAIPIQATATADSTIVVVGLADREIADRDERTLDGIPSGDWGDPDPFVLVLSSDFKDRLSWAPLTATGSGTTRGVAVGVGSAAVLSTQDAEQLGGGTLITADALQSAPTDALGEAHLVVFPLPAG